MEDASGYEPPAMSSNTKLFPATSTPASIESSSSSTILLDTVKQLANQPTRKTQINEEGSDSNCATSNAGLTGTSQTAAFLNDVRKRWQQHVDQSGPPAKQPRISDEKSTTIPETKDGDGRIVAHLTVESNDGNARKNSSAVGVSPIPGQRGIRKRGKKSRDDVVSDYSNSDDDKPSPKTPKSDGSDYEPSSVPTSDSAEVEEFDEQDEGLSDEDDSGDKKKVRKPKGILTKKKMPVIGALAFLASNSRRSSDSESEEEINGEDDNAGGDGVKEKEKEKDLLGAKNSFEMLRRLREMRQKKVEPEPDGHPTTSADGDGKTDANHIFLDRGDSSSSLTGRRRSSVDENNIDRGVTERYALSRKRQVVLSDDEDGNSNSNSCTATSTTRPAPSKSPSPETNVRKKVSNVLRKTVVYSSSDESDTSVEYGDDDDGAANEKTEKPPFQVTVSRKASKSEIQDMCVQYFNYSTAEQLSNIPRCSDRIAEALIAQRPFDSFDDLLDKVEDLKVKGSSVQIVTSYLQIVECQNDLDRLLQACQRIASHLQSSVDDLLNGQTATVGQPASITQEHSLKPYQIVGLNWLILMHRNHLNAVLADEMGLGKTVQVIAFLAYLKEQNVGGPHIVVVPSSTMDNWLNEFHRWCPILKVLTYYGSLEDRKFLRKEIQSGRQTDFDVILSTYRVITSNADDRSFFKRLNANYAVFDEAHMLKSCHTARYKSLMKIKAQHRLLLTGTPLQNNLVELVSLLHFVMPALFRDHIDDIKDILTLFQAKNGSLGEYEQEKIGQAKGIMKPFVLRRLKADVLSQLPEKHDKSEYCELSGRQAELYGDLVAEYSASVCKQEEDGQNCADAKGMFMQLRKVANHPLLVRALYTDERIQKMAKALKKEKSYKEADAKVIFEDLAVMNDFQLHRMCKQHRTLNTFKLKQADIDHSTKFVALDNILPEIKAQGNKVLLFSQFTMVLDILEEFMKSRRYKYLRLDGSTPVVERQLMIDKYNNTPTLFAFLLSTRAGGLGINLTSANNIILHDIDYNPYNDKQAEDRCHRVGQTKEVMVIRLIARNTVDETMLACAQKKLQLEQQITGPSHDEEDDENSRDVESLLKQALKL